MEWTSDDRTSGARRRLTILVTTFNATGHMDSIMGATRTLMERGHRMIVVVDRTMVNRYHPLGYEEFVYDDILDPTQPERSTPPAGKWLAQKIHSSHIMNGHSSPEKRIATFGSFFADQDYLPHFRNYDRALAQAIDRYRPDIICYDSRTLAPSVYFSRIPWIKIVSFSPTFELIDESEIPPGGSGYDSKGDRSKWPAFNELRRPLFRSETFQQNFVTGLGYPNAYPEDALLPSTQLLTVYAYPDELNFSAIRNRSDWFNLETFRHDPIDREVLFTQLIPEKFMLNTLDDRFTGKYVYVAFGTLVSYDLELMRRILRALAETDHKYIVSLGLRGDELHPLPENVWGECVLPQSKILHHVDAVITHGGNTTFTEAFAAGKPMLIMPLFGDHLDNAQRIVETDFGARLDPYQFSVDDLRRELDRLLYNASLGERLRVAACRIQQSDAHERLAVVIENLAMQNLPQKIASDREENIADTTTSSTTTTTSTTDTNSSAAAIPVN